MATTVNIVTQEHAMNQIAEMADHQVQQTTGADVYSGKHPSFGDVVYVIQLLGECVEIRVTAD